MLRQYQYTSFVRHPIFCKQTFSLNRFVVGGNIYLHFLIPDEAIACGSSPIFIIVFGQKAVSKITTSASDK